MISIIKALLEMAPPASGGSTFYSKPDDNKKILSTINSNIQRPLRDTATSKRVRSMRTAMGGSWTDGEEINKGQIITERKTFGFLKNLKKDALHKDLGVPSGEKIPESKLEIKKNDTPLEKKRKQFAINAAKWRKK